MIESFLPKLEEIIDLCVYELNDFIVFTDMYCKQIKKINFSYNEGIVPVSQLLTQLSRYQNIESLVFCLTPPPSPPPLPL